MRLAPLLAGFLAGFLAACTAGTGPAVDWNRDARISGTITADSNRSLNPEAEALLASAVSAGLVLTAETKRALFSADLGITALYSLGDDDDESATGIYPQLAASAAYEGKTYSLTGIASLDARSTAFTQVDELGQDGTDIPVEFVDPFPITEQETTQFSIVLGADLALSLDPRNSVTVGIDGREIRFAEAVPGLVQTRTIGGNIGWQHQVSELSSVTLSAGMRDFRADDGDRSQTLDLSSALTHQRTPRHTFTVGGGVSLVRTVDDLSGSDPTLDLGFTGRGTLLYQLKRLSAALALSQSVDPSSTEGALQIFNRASGSLSYDLTPRQSLGATLGYTRRAPLSGDGEVDQLLSLGPTYSIRLAPDTALSLGYLYRLSLDETAGAISGHQVFLTVGHDFDVP